ncbi:MAG: peptide deformylase, partial [Dehalococcoidia bacterium]
DGSLQTLIDDMLDTVRDAPGVGLAAPQIGVSLRLVVINVPEVPPFALINGAVVRHTGKRWVNEGCLSIPGYRGELWRSVRVTVKGLDRQGRPIRVRAVDDVLAQALEHEIDHTNGLLYVDLVSGVEHLHRIQPDAGPDAAVIGFQSPEAVNGEEAPADPARRLYLPRRRGRRPLITRPRRRLSLPSELFVG